MFYESSVFFSEDICFFIQNNKKLYRKQKINNFTVVVRELQQWAPVLINQFQIFFNLLQSFDLLVRVPLESTITTS